MQRLNAAEGNVIFLENALQQALAAFRAHDAAQQARYLNAFREYRVQATAEAKRAAEPSRELLGDAIKDAIKLSTRNTELMSEIARLRANPAGNPA